MAKKGFCNTVSNKYCHVVSSSLIPGLMVGDADTLVHDTGGNNDCEHWFKSADPWLQDERVRKLNKSRVREVSHTSGVLQKALGHPLGLESSSTEDLLACIKHILEPPSIEDLIRILQKCRRERILGILTRVHTHICHCGLETNEVLGNILFRLFMECKCMAESHKIFNKLEHLTEYSWTSLLRYHNEYGDHEKALHILTTMQAYCVCPTKHTYVAILNSFAGEKYLKLAQEMHARVVMDELDQDPFIVNSLVGVYAKCGLLLEARKVLQGLLIPSIVSWTSLISGYAEHREGEKALYCLRQMQLEGICPNAFTFACGLKACASVGAADRGQHIHSVIILDQFRSDFYVGNALVEMYVKCGSLIDAQRVFDLLPERDVVTWTTMVAGYGYHGLGEKAVNLLEEMHDEGVPMNAVTFAVSLKACASMEVPYRGGQLVHSNTIKAGVERNTVVGNALIDMYAKCGSLVEAQAVFDWLPARNVISCMDATTYISSLKACGSICALNIGHILHSLIVEDNYIKDPLVGNSLVCLYAKCHAEAEAKNIFSQLALRSVVAWTALIALYHEQGLAKEVLDLMNEMHIEGICPDDLTFLYGLQACGILRALDRGQLLHMEIAKHGVEGVLAVGNTLIDMYDKCHALPEAWVLFEKTSRSTASWSALIAGYSDNDFFGEALILFEQMQLEGFSPNAAVYVTSLKACGALGAAKKGGEVHSDIVKRDLLTETGLSPGVQVCRMAESIVAVGNALIDMYAKCSDVGSAQNVFESLPKCSVETWNVLMVGLTRTGEDELVFGLFERLCQEEKQPNEVTFLSLLTACSHAGLVQTSHECFIAMSKEYGIHPTIEHHNCTMDVLGRAGQLKHAVRVLEKMPSHPNMSSWNTILAACRKWGNVELARRAFKCAMTLDENHAAAAFISMYNIYADAHMWTDARRIEERRGLLAHGMRRAHGAGHGVSTLGSSMDTH